MRLSYFQVAAARPGIRGGHCVSVLVRFLSGLAGAVAIVVGPSLACARSMDGEIFGFTRKYCSNCHNSIEREGGLDLTTLKYAPADSGNFLTWVKVHDRVQSGEMPPKEVERPSSADVAAFVKVLGASLTAADRQIVAREGR